MATRGRTQRIYPRKLADGTVRYDVTIDYLDAGSGKRIQKRKTFESEGEARVYLAQSELNRARGRAAAPTRDTVASLARDWLRAQGMRVKQTTILQYERQIRRHVLADLGDVRLAQLTGRRLEQHYAALQERGLGDASIRLAHRRVVQLLGYAVRLRLLDVNVARDLPLPGYGQRQGPIKRDQVWDEGQVERFLAAIKGSYYGPLWHVALATGMRRGELLGLRWRDVDEAGGWLHVRQNRAYLGSSYVTSTTKGGLERSISVDAGTFAALRAQRAKQGEWRLALGDWPDHDRVFTTCTGETPHPHYLYQNLGIWQRRLGLPRIRVHDLRHTHATMLLRHGRTVKEVSERLGHANAAMTLRVYAHALPQDHAETARLIGRLLGPY